MHMATFMLLLLLLLLHQSVGGNALAATFSTGHERRLEGIRKCQGLLQAWPSRSSS